ncbi:hypothetical protein ACFQV4_16445 [Streptomyces thermocarboxydus]
MTHHVLRLRRVAAALVVAGLFTATTAGCSTGPTTQEEVCDKYDSLGNRLGIGQVFGNPVFSAAGDLADVAGRYEGPEDLSADAERLESIADSDSTSNWNSARPRETSPPSAATNWARARSLCPSEPDGGSGSRPSGPGPPPRSARPPSGGGTGRSRPGEAGRGGAPRTLFPCPHPASTVSPSWCSRARSRSTSGFPRRSSRPARACRTRCGCAGRRPAW